MATAHGGGLSAGRNRWVALAVACTAGLLVLTGCAKMDAALDQQWLVVDFGEGTSVAAALHVRAACSHIQNTPPMALPAKRTFVAMMYGVRYDTTNASPANLAELQTCLQRFPSVQGVEPEDAGDEGS
ncbi:MAG: hypothetical protein ACRDOK_27235 [Streptosporangiaceae bacterium]